MHFLQAINSDISVLIVCSNKTVGTIKGDIKKKNYFGCLPLSRSGLRFVSKADG